MTTKQILAAIGYVTISNHRKYLDRLDMEATSAYNKENLDDLNAVGREFYKTFDESKRIMQQEIQDCWTLKQRLLNTALGKEEV